LRIFFIVRFIALNVCLFYIEVSFQNIKSVSRKRLAKLLWAGILHVEFDCISIDILKREWVMISSFNSVVTMPAKIIDNAIQFSKWIFTSIKFIKNILSISSKSSRKKKSFSSDVIAWQRTSNAALWFTLRYIISRFTIIFRLLIL